ncbi:MAG: DAK2 domain-containing protein [Clostridiales bacterium]|nr:DAK2 domain-containing protein [Clostridiales bacterium]
MQKTINSTEFRKMIASGARMLEINRAKVDALNVFPVPDGDTGTNMSLTMQSSVKEMNACNSNRFQEICDAVSKGALRGARGNSGVISSQIFRGICSVIREVPNAFDTKTFAKALEAGTKVAYSAVSIPKEGTILTVIRMMSEAAPKLASKNKDFVDFLTALIEVGNDALAKTPELLPVLKKAGVVDSGGVGLMTIISGFLAALTGEELVADSIPTDATETAADNDFSDNSDIINLDLGDIEFAYCTEFFVINLKPQTTLTDIDKLKNKLMELGDSVICIGDLEFIKVHVHTNTPGIALSYALELGEIDRIKIENMLEENRALKAKLEAEKKEMGMLAICAGEGLAEIFKDLMCDRVIEGGQTMNPSASDIADAVQKINAANVFVMPNNSNIILAAEQAKALVENRTIHVIPTKNVPQGFSAALAFNPEASVPENKTNMTHAIDNVKSGQVTYAVRNTTMNGFKLKEGDIIGLDAKKILAKGNNVEDTTIALIKKMINEEHEMITLYYGEGVKEEDAEALVEKVQEQFPDCDVDFHYGGQPVYYYMVSLE